MSTVQTVLKACSFCDSATYQGILTAIRREQQGRQIYERVAYQLENLGLYVIAYAFCFAAAQEKEHADVFRGLAVAHGGQPDPDCTEPSLLLPEDPVQLLRGAIQSEQEEGDCYAQLALTAREEGYPRIATAFQRIAETECLHARRFRQYLDALRQDSLFREEGRASWVCLHCGQFHAGQEPPLHCSACQRNRGHFIRSSYHPFSVEE